MSVVKFLTADNWVEAESIRTYLAQFDIEVHVPDRKFSGSLMGEPDLRLGGYSATTTGFILRVDEKDLVQAKSHYKEWVNDIRGKSRNFAGKEALDHLKYFVRWSLIALFLPLIPLVMGVYHGSIYISQGGPITPKFLLGLLLHSFGAIAVTGVVYMEYTKAEILF